MITTVTKRDGSVVPFDAEKLNMWGEWASQHDVAWSDVVIKTLKKLYEGISTVDLHTALVSTCAEYQTEKHLRMAARLLRGDIYKTVYGSSEPQPFSERYKKLVSEGYWRDYKLSDEKLAQLDELIDHDYNDRYEYAAMKQFYDKYGLGYFTGSGKDKKKWLVETPQERLMIIAISKFHKYWDKVTPYYKRLRQRQININTPTMMSSGTPEASNASCCVITAGDTSPSISATTEVAYGMTGSRAGIGFEFAIRSAGDVVGNNKCLHTGKIQHYRMLTESVKAVVQGQGRVGAITMTYNVLDPEIDDLLRLKRPATHQDKRITTMDYSLAVNNEFLRRVAKNQEWLLISMREAPDLYEAFYDERAGFTELLELYLKSGMGQVVKAREIALEHLRTRQETGKQYDYFLDNGNDHTPFLETIRLSNLCQEIQLPTKPVSSSKALYEERDDDGVVALCFLMALDVAKIESDEDYEEAAYLAAASLDTDIEEMDYPYPLIGHTAKNYRSIGVGMTNVAYHMAKKGLFYDTPEGLAELHRLAERHYYFMLKASIRLAKERGKFGYIDRTKWAKGWLPIDTYKKEIDEHVDNTLHYDWEELRKEVLDHGVRFSVLTAHMPCESSSLWGGSTNGLYPIREGLILKGRGEGKVPFIAPEFEKLSWQYQKAWNVDSLGLLKGYGVIQKFTDQAISSDSYVDFDQYPDRKKPMTDILKEYLFAAKIGLKTRYYSNSKTQSSSDDADCESCKL